MEGKNVFPIFDKVIDRKNKEALLKQHALVIWMTGLSGSGKTTLAIGLEKYLHDNGFLAYILDGDNVRTGISGDLGFSEKDRKENIRRIAEVSKLFISSGVITINSFVSPSEESRQMAKKIIGEKDFFQVYVNTPIEICEKRDTKGLYAKARKGEIKDFTGISAPFDEPKSPDLEILTDKYSYEECLKQFIDFVLPKVKM
ncbi:MAG TPA: adenylyl-sulfate kinase [Bacteroidia bacterium]|jgi:adenylylsulfate kinase|nr:adenylyl-sulfate kinase [Bacteroidia bacterium]